MMVQSPSSANTGPVSGALVFMFFLALALLFIFLKTPVLHLLQSEQSQAIDYQGGWIGICDNQLRPCLRIASATVQAAIEGGLRVLISPFFWDLSRSPIAATTPWPPPELGPYIMARVIPVTATILYLLLCLAPIYYGARLLFPGTLGRLLFLGAAFGAIFGWHPLLPTIYFDLVSLVVDYPRSYYLYQINLAPYDFMAMALVVGVIVYAAKRDHKRLWEMALIAAVGQLTIEHLGFVLGVSLAIAALYETGEPYPMRLRTAATRLAVTGGASLLVILPSLWGFYEMGFATSSGAEKPWLVNNLAWWKAALANFVTMASLAVPAGIVAGAVGARGMTTTDARQARAAMAAGIGVFVAYIFVFIGGLYFLSYPAEMSRQFAPMSLAVAILAATGSANVIYRRRSVGG